MDKGDIYHTDMYGDLKILKYLDSKHVEVQFINTGFITTTTASNIRKGVGVRDKLVASLYYLGYIGEGNYSSTKDSKAYKTWESMLRKCLLTTELTVSEDWRNFQKFAEWYYQSFKEGTQLTLTNSTEYSKDTCCFLTKTQIASVSGEVFVFQDKNGASHQTSNKAEFARIHNLDPSALSRLSKGKQKNHKGWTFIGVAK